ncbi:MAG TPA: trypsin-like peptidase domain-containing protein [Candidatus Acidoferrales bacterium]|nr:trypsin-like peptidase domain-containing protein [Candidatus Acidoferrales bacterium]
MIQARSSAHAIRLLALGALIILLTYWAGARWGPRHSPTVGARPGVLPDINNTKLAEEELINVRIYRQVAPGVANVVTRTVEYDFFLNPVPVAGAGSGFVIDGRGYILTNFHVVQDAQSIEVTLGDQSRYPAKLVGADQRNDVALIKIDPRERKLTTLPLGDSAALQVGQRVLAIGNPFGFQSTLTTGVVSALGRTVQTGQSTFIDEAVQTDAAINQGNSGGPLLNTHGEVIGINTAIYTPSGTTAGIGFAIPINTAKLIAQDLITTGRIHRTLLGVEVRPLWPGLAEALELPVEEGLLVERVTPGGPAEHAGVRGGDRAVVTGMRRILIGGDVLVGIDGQNMTSQLDLNLFMNKKRPGDVVTLALYRGRKKIEVRVTLGER